MIVPVVYRTKREVPLRPSLIGEEMDGRGVAAEVVRGNEGTVDKSPNPITGVLD